MDASRGAGYGLGISQFAIALGVVLLLPSVHVGVFVPRATLGVPGNSTAPQLTVRAEGVRFHMGLPVLGVSLLAAIFSVVSCRTQEQGLSGQDYQPDVVEQMGLWDLLFWAFCMAAHATVALLVADPMDGFGAISCTAFMSYFLVRCCAPRGQSLTNLTQENMHLLGYCFGMLQLAYQLTETRDNGAAALCLMVVVDYFLGFGHTYDRQATIDTVNNCRLFYVCAGGLGCTLLYGLSS